VSASEQKGARLKKLLVLMVLALAVFVAVQRQRIFLWDPLARVERAGVKLRDVRVMINYSNDVLLDDRSTNTRRLYLVQHWNGIPERPAGPLKCLEFLACMTDADRAAGEKLAGAKPATMHSRLVEFTDENGTPVRVALR